MECLKVWSVVLKHNIMGAADVLPPTTDIFDPDVFYISDGWQTAYGGMRFRKLSLETGEELANVSTRDTVRCIQTDKESIYAILNKRILKLNRQDLSIQERYTQNVPRYADYAEFIEDETLMLMNYYSGTIQRFDLKMQKSHKKATGEKYSFYDVIKADSDTFFIFHEKAVFRYSPKTNMVKKVLDTEPCIRCDMDSTQRTYLLCQKPVEKICDDGKSQPYSSKVLVYSSLTQKDCEEWILGCIANYFWLSEEQLLYLVQDNALWIYSIAEKRLIFHDTFETGFVYNVFVNSHSILTYDRKNYCLTCYKIK